MCGRFSLGVDTDRLIAEFGLGAVVAPHEPRFNIAPTQPVPAVVAGAEGLRLGTLRWGLVPAHARDPGGRPLINARSESVDRTRAFRGPFLGRRCWVLADGFYEWRRERDGSRTPYHVRLRDGRPFAFAGLWDRWRGEDAEILSCAILTCPPNDAVAPIHDRMPVILSVPDRSRWLDPAAPSEELRSLLRPFAGPMEVFPVSARVNDARHDEPGLRDPVAASS